MPQNAVKNRENVEYNLTIRGKFFKKFCMTKINMRFHLVTGKLNGDNFLDRSKWIAQKQISFPVLNGQTAFHLLSGES